MNKGIEMKEQDKDIKQDIDKSMYERRIIPVTLENSLREIILEHRDWIVDGHTCSWEYYLTPDKSRVVLERW